MDEECCDRHRRAQQLLEQQIRRAVHEFNNILTSIHGFSQFLIDDLAPGSTTHGYAQRVFESSERGRDLIRKLNAEMLPARPAPDRD